MVELAGFLSNNAGAGICGATVHVFPDTCNATCATAAPGACFVTTTGAGALDAGYWSFSSLAANAYDVRITCGSSVRWHRAFSEAQMTTLQIIDAGDILFGHGNDSGFRWSTADADNHAFVLAVGQSNQVLHIAESDDIALDWNIAANAADAEVLIHSSTTPATDYMRIGAHDGTTALVDVVGGTTLALQIAGASEATLTATVLDILNNTLDNPGGACNVWNGCGITTAGFVRILNQGGLRLREGSAGGTNEIILRAPAALAADYTLTLPTTDGCACQRLTTDGSGGLSWTTVTGVTLNCNTNNYLATMTGTAGTLQGEANLTFTGLILSMQNTTDAASNQALVIGGGNRAVPADNDEVYVTFNLDNCGGTQTEFVRLTAKALDVGASCTYDSRPEFQYYTAGTLRELAFPAITADDTVTVLGLAQTFSAEKTVSADFILSAAAARWSSGVAVVGAEWSIQRDADATNQLHLNVPACSTFELSVNDAAEATLSATVLDILNNTLDNPGGACNVWNSCGVTTAGFVRILNQGGLRLREGSGGGTNEVIIRSPATLAADYTLTLPADDGTACQRLTTDGTGGLSWATVTGGSGAFAFEGSDTTVSCTTSTTVVALQCVTGICIPAANPFAFTWVHRRTCGGAACRLAVTGLRVNCTNVITPTTVGAGWPSGGQQNAQTGGGWMFVAPRVACNLRGIVVGGVSWYRSCGATGFQHNASCDGQGTAWPTAAITAVRITGLVSNAAVTLTTDELYVYQIATS